MSGVLCDRKVPPRVKGKIHRTVVQPAMLYGMETVPLSISDTKGLEVAEMKMCRWALRHTLKDHRRDEVYVGRRVMDMRLPGRRKRGSPKLRWTNCVRRDLDSIGAKEEDALDRSFDLENEDRRSDPTK
ncbi:uncharacterized protein LOC125045702 [Penaeus chinensis]|uniref:uncharacterized protein LOC125045702 n=1 Tax=Penaeus chinensis TaxID=139456 RepID=UPI001FB84A6C|nr:uncharacterized protein LOC125045702 [Penaeus chinensis]